MVLKSQAVQESRIFKYIPQNLKRPLHGRQAQQRQQRQVRRQQQSIKQVGKQAVQKVVQLATQQQVVQATPTPTQSTNWSSIWKLCFCLNI